MIHTDIVKSLASDTPILEFLNQNTNTTPDIKKNKQFRIELLSLLNHRFS